MPVKANKQAARMRALVEGMPIVENLGLEFIDLSEGASELRVPVQDTWSFRPGYLQAAAVFAAADFAAVSAAGTLLPEGAVNATVDGTVKLVAPATGTHLLARGRVVHAGRRNTVCAAEVFAVNDDGETLCATFLGSAQTIFPEK